MKTLNAGGMMLKNSKIWLTLGLALIITNFLQPKAASAKDVQILLKIKGGWEVQFNPSTSTLECFHSPSGTRLSGKVSFVADLNERSQEWKVDASRDYDHQRLALLDGNGDAQAYVMFAGDTTRLEINVMPRPPHLFSGQLIFSPEINFGSKAFACRTHLPQRAAVVQMASGNADSLLNDSLFDVDRDLALRFGAKTVTISTVSKADEENTFTAKLCAALGNPETARIVMEIMPDYYRDRYVPNYKPIDRKRCPTAPSGWMSWNTYFDTAGEKENLDEARIGAKYLKPFGLEIWSIESWQENSPHLPVSDFHNLNLKSDAIKFPSGMKWLAQQIRELGFRPGIWVVQWGTGDTNFYEEHRDWFLHDPQGRPMHNWSGRFVLDPSQSRVRQFMENNLRVESRDWGYEFFKLDGMSGREPSQSAHFFERPEVRAAFRNPGVDVYPLCIKTFRKGIGPDSIWLACQGHYTGPEVGLVDAARLGADIVHPNQPPQWEGYLNQGRLTQAQMFTHNIIWYGDPDTLLVGDPTTLSMARLATTIIGLPGQVTFFGDKLGNLSSSRMRLLQQVLPVCNVRPMDLFPNPELKPIWDLKLRRTFASWDVVSVFNWEDQPADIGLNFKELGLDSDAEYLVYNFWDRKFLGVKTNGITNHIDARANVLLAVHKYLGHPQLLSTDRHVSQGGVEWIGSTWDADKNELSCSFNLVQGDALTAAVYMPIGYQLASATAEGADLKTSQEDNIISATLRRTTSGKGLFKLKFEKVSNSIIK